MASDSALRGPVVPVVFDGPPFAVVTFATVGFAAFTVLIVGARLVGLSFSAVVAGAAAIGALLIFVAGRRLLAVRTWAWRREMWVTVLLVTVSVACGARSCAINAPEEDDAMYTPPAVQALAHPDRPLSAELTWIVPFSNGATPRSNLVLFENVALFWACISRLTGIPLLSLYQVAGAFVFGAAFPIVHFTLLSRLLPSARAALTGTLVTTLAACLVFREGGLGYGLLLNKIWLGKAILMGIMVPVVAGFALDFARLPSLKRWLLLCASAIASTGCSPAALFLIPALLLALAPGALWQRLSEGGPPRWRRALEAAVVPAAGAFPAAFGAFFYVAQKAQISTFLEPAAQPSSASVFASGVAPYFGSYFSATSVVVLLSLVWLITRRQRAHRPLLMWFATAVVVFANPWTAGLVARNITSVVAYSRIFYVLPLFALVGVAAGDLTLQLRGRAAVLLTLTILEAAGLYAFRHPSSLQLDAEKFRVLGWPRAGAPFIRIDPNLLADARELARLAPSGNTLAAIDYQLVLSMTTSQFPQYSLWPIDIITLFGQSQGASDDSRIRYNAARFLIGIGGAQFRPDFEHLLDTGARNVILSNRLGNDLTEMKTAASARGFVLVRETSRYVLFTKASRP